MHLSCLHSHCNTNQGHKIHRFSPGAVFHKAWISAARWGIISALLCWVTFPHRSWCPPVLCVPTVRTLLSQSFDKSSNSMYLQRQAIFHTLACMTCHCTAWGCFITWLIGWHSIPVADTADSIKNIFWSFVLIYKKVKVRQGRESTSVCFCFIWEVSNPACTMTCTTITLLENLKYTHLYKPDPAFQNIWELCTTSLLLHLTVIHIWHYWKGICCLGTQLHSSLAPPVAGPCMAALLIPADESPVWIKAKF